jgi:hypothetical protein
MRIYVKRGPEAGLRNVVFKLKTNRPMNNVEKLDNCIGIPSEQTFRSELAVLS